VRVLSLVASLDPQRGGTQSGATNVLISTQRAGVSNVVATAGTSASRRRARALTDLLECEGVVVHQFPTPGWPPERPDRWGLSLRQVGWVGLRIGDFDLLHIHGAWGLSLLSGLAAATARRRPIVVSPHESFTAFDIDASRSAVRRREKLLLKRLYLRWATLFTLTSDLEVTDSLPAGKRERARSIPSPLVDPGASVPRLVRRGTCPELRVGFLGRIHPKKNLGLLIDALTQLPDHVRLAVAGDGPMASEVRKRASARGVDSRVEWLGFVTAEQRSKMLEGLDLLAMPSVFESFGISAAEAMLHGVPVLVSERTGIAEVIRRRGGGITVTPGVDSIADAIRELDRERSALSDMGARAQDAVCTELSFSRVGEAFRAAYADALELSARRSAAP
jgi:glycosyltransferase involved in cell wall biosynthesis